MLLFNLMPGESVLDCFKRCTQKLTILIMDDASLNNLVLMEKYTSQLNSNRKRNYVSNVFI